MRTILTIVTLISAATLIFLTTVMLAPRCGPGERGVYAGGVLIVGCPR